MEAVSLCKTCDHCMSVCIEDPSDRPDMEKVVCLVYPDIFTNTDVSMYTETKPFARVVKCSKYAPAPTATNWPAS